MTHGDADVFLDRIDDVSKASMILVGAQPLQRLLDAPLATVLQAPAQLSDEVIDRNALPIPVVEELVLQRAIELYKTSGVSFSAFAPTLLTPQKSVGDNAQPVC
jgi:hypothetical protein